MVMFIIVYFTVCVHMHYGFRSKMYVVFSNKFVTNKQKKKYYSQFISVSLNVPGDRRKIATFFFFFF